MAKTSGHKKSFPRGGTALPVNKQNPTGGVMKNSGGFTGRAVNPTVKPYAKKGNP